MRSRVLTTSSIALVVVFGVAWAAHTQTAPQTAASSDARHPTVTKQQVDTWMKELSNWGRWGKDDQLGTMNLITEAKRKQALALAKTGTVVSLAHKPPLVPKAQAQSAGAFLEIKLSLLSAAFTTEEQQLAFHGSSFTHIDALCHGDHDGKIYNGYPLKESVTEAGCKKLGIDALQGGVVTRGVLIDIPRLKGVSHLEPGTHVYQEDIEAWEKRAGVTISSGDAIFLHTGRWETGKTSGYDVSLIPWLKKRDVALISSDGIQDVSEVEGTILPLHHYTLVALGANILDNAELTALSETANRLKRWEFLFVTAPVATPGGTGSPVNPLAIF
jgi:kynurenine formamidase